MWGLPVAVALGWFWITFYGVGPLTSDAQIAEGGVALIVGLLASTLLGFALAHRRSSRAGQTAKPSVRR